MKAFERAETSHDAEEIKRLLTFIVIGGGPTGVELAGSLAEMSRFTLAKDYKRINPKSARIILVEAGPTILASFDSSLSNRAAKDLKQLGVEVLLNHKVSEVNERGIMVNDHFIHANTVVWAAGVQASMLGASLSNNRDPQGRVPVNEYLNIEDSRTVFVAGDQARCEESNGKPLPGVATVALQQGRYLARTILADVRGAARVPFRYWDKGQMATIGRSRAIVQSGKLRLTGFIAWISWLLVHIYYLSGFKNRVLVLLQWAWSYLTFARGARLVTERNWRSYHNED